MRLGLEHKQIASTRRTQSEASHEDRRLEADPRQREHEGAHKLLEAPTLRRDPRAHYKLAIVSINIKYIITVAMVIAIQAITNIVVVLIVVVVVVVGRTAMRQLFNPRPFFYLRGGPRANQ